MDDDRIEQLLRGYRLPEVSRDLDDRALHDGAAILADARPWPSLGDAGRWLLDRLGFGYLAWLVDWTTAADAEYSVELI
jgi:hypothetical protein